MKFKSVFLAIIIAGMPAVVTSSEAFYIQPSVVNTQRPDVYIVEVSIEILPEGGHTVTQVFSNGASNSCYIDKNGKCSDFEYFE